MKTLLSILAMATIFSCTSPEIDPKLTTQNNGRRPQTIFEGKWTWEGTATTSSTGTSKRDSVSEGHSIWYEFTYSDLIVYRNQNKLESLTYTWRYNDNPADCIIELKKNSQAVTTSNWSHFVTGEKHYLVFKRQSNDGSFAEERFRRIALPNLSGSK
jgi:hypothetical protein